MVRPEARRPSLKMYYPCFACMEILPTVLPWSKRGGNGDRSERPSPGSIPCIELGDGAGLLPFPWLLWAGTSGRAVAVLYRHPDCGISGNTHFCLKRVSVFCLGRFTQNFKESVILQLILPRCWRCLDACIVFFESCHEFSFYIVFFICVPHMLCKQRYCTQCGSLGTEALRFHLAQLHGGAASLLEPLVQHCPSFQHQPFSVPPFLEFTCQSR